MRKEDISDDGFILPVLGTDYIVQSWSNKDHEEFFVDKCGLCDGPAHKITIENLFEEHDPENTSNADEFMNQTLRHELVHAFFFENGLAGECQTANNEMFVDWLALQAPKLMKLFLQAKAFSEEDIKGFRDAFKAPNRQVPKSKQEKKKEGKEA